MWPFKKIRSISLQEVPKGGIIIDVREPYEYKNSHIKGAKNIPLGKISNYTTKDTVYVICASGTRSKRATKVLMNKGIDAVNIKGGMLRNG